MMRTAAHPCPVAGCGRTRLRWQAVCPKCWGRLPEDLRRRVLETRRDRGMAHLRARAESAAVAWLRAQVEAGMRMAPG